MKQKVNFEVKKEENKIIFHQIVEKRMSLTEAAKELNVLRKELAQLESQYKSMNQAVKENKIEKDMKALKEQSDNLRKTEEQWTKLIAPLINEIRDKIKRKVRKLKLTTGYNRIDNTDLRIIKQNEILAPLCEEFEVDITHPIIMEIKRDFDKIK